jgi:hypothetical protein
MDLEDVLARLGLDPEFRRRVLADPITALAGYQLTADDLASVQAWFGRPEEPGPGVAALLADGAAAAPGPPPQSAAVDLFSQMLERPELARRVREDPAAVAVEWRIPLAEVRRLGRLEVGGAVGAEPPQRHASSPDR